jgi:hypothetical protein
LDRYTAGDAEKGEAWRERQRDARKIYQVEGKKSLGRKGNLESRGTGHA